MTDQTDKTIGKYVARLAKKKKIQINKIWNASWILYGLHRNKRGCQHRDRQENQIGQKDLWMAKLWGHQAEARGSWVPENKQTNKQKNPEILLDLTFF
jgi:hypothetical protein